MCMLELQVQLIKSRKKISSHHGLQGYRVLRVDFSHCQTTLFLLDKEGCLASTVSFGLAPTQFFVH